MANYDSTAWSNLPLVKRLRAMDEYTWYDIKQQINKLAPLLSWRPIGLEEYTDHDINHCYRVLKALGNIIPESFELSKSELEILIYSVVFHDIGMWTKKGEVEKSLSDEDFILFFQEQKTYSTIKQLLDSSVTSDNNLGFLLLREVVANYHRMQHPARSASILNDSRSDTYIDSRISEEKIAIIANVCAAHGWDLDEVLNSELLDQHRLEEHEEYDDESEIIIDIRLLAMLLRIGDLLDLDAKRIPSIIRIYLDPISSESEAHWKKHEWLHFKKLNPDIIQIMGNFDSDRYGSIAVDSYNLAKTWCSYLDDDINALKKMLHFPMKYDLKQGRHLGGLLLDVSGIRSGGILFADKLSFAMDKSRIMEILGDEIYDDKSAFVRELIQNAIDATRTQMVDDYNSHIYPNYNYLDTRTPNSWPQEITSKEQYAIHLRTGTSVVSINGKNKKLFTFEIHDKGIGMTIKQIRNYFLQIGKSYYQSKDFTANYKHSSISRFGIGFLTCLIIAKRIEVYTKSRREDEGIKVCMDVQSDIISAVKDDTIETYGTKVVIFFDPEITEDNAWLPDEKKTSRDKLYRLLHPDLIYATELIRAVYYWLPWSEFKIYINGKVRMPNSPMDILSNNSFWAFPFYVQSSEESETLATGSLVALRDREIPLLDRSFRIMSFLPSIGGVTIPPWEERGDCICYIDVYRQPQSVITASRRAKFQIPSNSVRKDIQRQIVTSIDEYLGKESISHRALFRAAVEIDIDDFDLILPVIRDGVLKWEYWNERTFRQTNCLMVPFFLPFKLTDYHNELPIVGVPRRKAFGPCQLIPRIEKVSATTVNNMCTGALNAPLAYYYPERIQTGYTFLLYRLCGYDDKKGCWEKADDKLAIQTPIRNQMFAWDYQDENPWKVFGFDSNEAISWYNANTYFGALETALQDMDSIKIKVSKREWDFLNRYKDDKMGDLLVDLFLRDCE